MTRFASTGLATVLASLAMTTLVYAQGTTQPSDDPMRDDTNMPPAPAPTPQPTPTSTPPVTEQAPVDTTIHGDVNVDGTATTTDATPPASVDVNVNTPDPQTTGTSYVVTPAPTVVVEEDSGPMSGIGIGIAAGGGAGGFVNDSLRNTTDVGGDWDVRATVGTRSIIAFEGSYIGSAQSINALGLDNNAVLVGNGVQGALRLNAGFNLPVTPFAYAGLGWRRYELTNTDQNLSDVRDSDDVLEVPLGIGIAGRTGGVLLDLRGEYRVARNADLLPDVNSLNNDTTFAAMNRWGVKGTIGLEF